MDFFSFLSDITINGVALGWVFIICLGVFSASFMDAIAGGGGIISVPIYLMALGNLPTYYTLGTNKMSACLGTIFSAGRFIKNGLVDWKLFCPAIFLSVLGSVFGTWLQHRTPDVILKYLLLGVLPMVSFFTLRSKNWPEEPEPMAPALRKTIIYCASLLIGCYDGYYGPGTGTFLLIVFIRLARLDTRHAAAGVKVINLSSNIGGFVSSLLSGYVLFGIGFLASIFSMAGHYAGSGLAIKNGSRIVKPAVITVLLLLTLKIGGELFFPL